MAAGADHQRPRLFRHVFQGHPHPSHEPCGVAVEVSGIAVDGLVAAHREVQGLKGKRFAPVQATQQLEDFRMQGHGLHRRRGRIAPALTDAHAGISPAAPDAQIHQRLQLQPHLIQQAKPLGILRSQQAVALLMQL